MDRSRFAQMVARLEAQSAQSPRLYQVKVALLALLGFGLIAVLLSFAGLGLLVIAGLALAMLASGGSALLLLLKLGKGLLLLALPLWFLVKSALAALFVRLPAPQGRRVTRQEAPALFEALDRTRKTMRGPRFHHVLLVDEMNAAVVQRPLFGLVGFPRNYLILGLPLLEAMAPDEALAVVAHEYGHLAGSHGRFGAFIYRLRNTWGTIQAIAERWSGWPGRLLRRPVNWYAPYFNAYTFVLARANEYQADAASADLVGREAAIAALKRVNVGGGSYSKFLQTTYEGTRSSFAPPQDLADRWALLASRPEAADVAQAFLAEALQRDADLGDTHPSLRQRLQALGLDADQMDRLPPPLARGSAARAWLGAALPGIRQEFQRQWAEQVSDGWREQYEQWEQRRQRLAELQSRTDLTPDETLQRLHLGVQLHPDDDHRAAVEAFNADHPDHAGGLYLEGVLRLQHGDEAGLPLIERTMALDPDAILPGCEQAWRFLSARQDPRAEDYARRWRERRDWEDLRSHQLQTLDPRGEVRATSLDPDLRADLVQRVRHASRDVARAWIARRVLPADPSVETFVLVVRLTWWARWRGRQNAVVDALANAEWPMHLFFFTDQGTFAKLAKRVRKLDGSRLF